MSGQEPASDFDSKEMSVGLLGGFAKAGVAKKVFDEARKPQNQAKIKEMIARARGGQKPTQRPR